MTEVLHVVSWVQSVCVLARQPVTAITN